MAVDTLPEARTITPLESARKRKEREILKTMDAIDEAHIPGFAKTMWGKDRKIILSHPYPFVEKQKPWTEISYATRTSLEREAGIDLDHPLADTLDVTWYMHPVFHRSGLYAVMILAGFNEYAAMDVAELVRGDMDEDTLARIRAVCIRKENDYQDILYNGGSSLETTRARVYDLNETRSEIDRQGKVHLRDNMGLIECVRVNNRAIMLRAIRFSKRAAETEAGRSEEQVQDSIDQLHQTAETAIEIRRLF